MSRTGLRVKDIGIRLRRIPVGLYVALVRYRELQLEQPHQEFDTAVNRGWPSLVMLFQPGELASSIWDNKEAKDEKVRYST